MTAKITDDVEMAEMAETLKAGGLLHALKERLKASKAAYFLKDLTPKFRKRVEILKEIQSEHDELERKFLEERRALEDKYQKLYQPLYAKRYDIVNGIAVFEVDKASNEPAADHEADKAADGKGVPYFWLSAMKNNEVLLDVIQEQDEYALGYLKDIKWYRVDLPKVNTEKKVASKGFKLEFYFNENPYFKNSVLTKTYYMIDEDEPILEKAVGTKIDWYPGKCLIQKVQEKKPKGSKNANPITKTEAVDSFFTFFSPPELPDDDEEIEEDVAEELQAQMEQDYDVGSTIRDKIIPHAVSWFTGEAAPDEDFEVDEEDDDEEEDDDNEEDADDDDDEDDERYNSQRKTNLRALGGDGQQAGERPAECKQQ